MKIIHYILKTQFEPNTDTSDNDEEDLKIISGYQCLKYNDNSLTVLFLLIDIEPIFFR